MKKKETEISVNSSSGAEKVERIEKSANRTEKNVETRKTATSSKRVAPKKTAKGASAVGGQKESAAAIEIKRENARSTDGQAERESQEAKRRVEVALEKKKTQEEKKEERRALVKKKATARKKKAEEKKAAIEKRAAEKKARAEKRAAERKALSEKRKREKEEKLRRRAEKKKEKPQKTKRVPQKRKEKRERENRSKGYGGWIAAVVSLGVVSLALATTVTVGAMEMNESKSAVMGGYRSIMYELTGIMENVDNDLDRIRVSNSPVQQSRILTDLLVQARLAELDLEKLPITAEEDRNATSFINRTAAECERMLAKLRNGEDLSQEDKEKLESLYAINHAAREEVKRLMEDMTDKDLAKYVKKGVGNVKDALDKIEKSTLEENTSRLGGKAEEKAKETGGEKRVPPPEKKERPHIEAAEAEDRCLQYFAGYDVADFQCIGETVSRGYAAYNIQGYDTKGNQLFAEISQADGKLLRFDYYEDCAGETFDVGNAQKIAEEFLEKLGYEDMEAVRVRANGTTSDFTFVYEEDDVAYYPDEIRVKVCRDRGVVSGFDATKYLRNHRGRDEVKVNFSLAEAYAKLYDGLEVESSRLAVIKTARGERTAYEFLCAYDEERYFVFLDALTGEEISIVNVKSIV